MQFEICDEHGYVLARVDLAYPQAKLAIEYDGSEHFTARRRERDLRRDAGLAARGWLTLRFWKDDLGSAATAWRVRSALVERRQVA